MRLTRHNGRAGKFGVYNPKHNDRNFNVHNSDHIDPERMNRNIYWNCYTGLSDWEHKGEDEELSGRFVETETRFYNEQYSDYCRAQHERNRKQGHSKRDRSPDDLRQDRRTCPEETILQIGTMEDHVSDEELLEIAQEYFNKMEERFGKHVHILDWGLHVDEATPHIHERHVFDCINKTGELAPQQERALECLGIERPYMDKPNSKYNNRKMTFDSICRTMLFEICREHGLTLEEVPEYDGRKHMEKQEFIIQKLDKKIDRTELKLHEQKVELRRLRRNEKESVERAKESVERAKEADKKFSKAVHKLYEIKHEIGNAEEEYKDISDKIKSKEKDLNDKLMAEMELDDIIWEKKALSDFLDMRIRNTGVFIRRMCNTVYDNITDAVSEMISDALYTSTQNIAIDETNRTLKGNELPSAIGRIILDLGKTIKDKLGSLFSEFKTKIIRDLKHTSLRSDILDDVVDDFQTNDFVRREKYITRYDEEYNKKIDDVNKHRSESEHLHEFEKVIGIDHKEPELGDTIKIIDRTKGRSI